MKEFLILEKIYSPRARSESAILTTQETLVPHAGFGR